MEKAKPSKLDYQQIFWKEEDKRAAERHQWAKQKHLLEMEEAQMKLELLKIEIELKKK